MLLNTLKSWSCNDSFTGGENKDSIVCIDIKYIKLANHKLAEYNLYKEGYYKKDSLISLNKKAIELQNKMITDLNSKLQSVNQINSDLQKKIERNRKTNIIIYSSIGGVILGGVIIGLIAK